MADNTPNSHKDPYWSELSSATEEKLGLPSGLLANVVMRGERSNNDQVSEAGAKTPFQIIPATRKRAIDKYGIDPYLSPENAAEVAGLLLKDSLDRNNGNEALAVAEYHGGTDRANWGPKTRAYVNRVMTGQREMQRAPQQGQSTFQRTLEARQPAGGGDAIAQVYDAYKSGRMTPEESSEFESDVNSGVVMLPKGAVLAGQESRSPTQAPAAIELPPEVTDAYQTGKMSEQERADLESDIKAGIVKLSASPTALPDFQNGQMVQEQPGIIQQQPDPTIGEQLAGAGETALALGTGATGGTIGMIGGTLKGLAEQLLSGNFKQGDVNNLVEKAAHEGAQALTYAPRTQAGQEQTQAAGEALAPLAAVAPMTAELGAIAQGARAAAPAALATLERAAPAARGTIQDVQQVAGKLAAVPEGAQAAPEPVIPPVAAPVAAPMASADLSAIAKQAATATGKTQTRAQKILAGEAAPDAETIASAKRLGIDDNLQADHVTTNQSFRELSQAIKSVPGSAARAQEMEGLQAIGRRADDLVTQLGGTKDVSTLSDNIKNQMLKTGDELDAVANDLYGQIRQNIPAGTRAAAPDTLKFIEGRIEALGGRENLSPLEKSIVKKLSPKLVMSTEREPGRAGITSPSVRKIETEVQPLYGLMDDVRKTVGQAARMNGPFKDADTGLAKKLYELITEDQNAAVKPLGMSELIDAAKAAVRTRKGLEDDTISLFGKNLGNSIVGNLSGATTGLGKGDTAKFLKLINAVPENLRQETTASALNYAFGKATQNGSLNFNTFARWWEGLERNKKAKAALLANLPKEGRQSLEDLYRVSNGIASASKERIVTGRLNAITKELEGTDTAIQRIYDAAKKSAGIAAAEVATSSVGAPGVGLASGITSALMKAKPDVLKAADKLIADPAFIAMAKASVKGQPPPPAAVKALAKSPALISFKKALHNPPEMTNLEQWLAGLFLSEAQQNNQGGQRVLH